MSSAHDHPLPTRPPEPAHPLRTIRDIRGSLPSDQPAHFDAELAVTDLDELGDEHRMIYLFDTNRMSERHTSSPRFAGGSASLRLSCQVLTGACGARAPSIARQLVQSVLSWDALL